MAGPGGTDDSGPERERYRRLVEMAADIVVILDLDGTVRYANAAVERVLGYDPDAEAVGTTPGELEGQSVAEIEPAIAQLAAAPTDDRAVIESGEPQAGIETEFTTADGETRIVQMTRIPFETEKSGADAVLSYARDVTELKAHERDLAAREAKYRNLFEDTRDALMLLDRDGFFDCNEQALDLFGVESVAEFVEYAPWQLSPPEQPDGTESKEAALAHVDQAFEEGEAFFEWTHQRADGTEFPAEVKLSRFEHEGEPALHALVRDITERKEYQRQIEAQRDNLDVLNQVLRHDIRNDLQLIIAHGEALASELEDETLQDSVETVLENADHAVELTTSAREMADVMLSADEELQRLSLRNVLESELEEVQSAYPEAVVIDETEIPPVSVRATDMLGSVFRNLLKNAIQHNDEGVPRVAVSASERADTAVVRVADNGPGVPDDQKDDIFGKGEKGLDSHGTGIGLYLVKTLVENYDGDVWVEDRAPGRDWATLDDESGGAVFVVELPLAQHG